MSRKFIITENDRKRILGLYGLLTEQYFTAPSGGSAVVMNSYGPGFYSLKHTDKYGNKYDNEVNLKKVIDDGILFLQKNKGYIPKVVINAGESIIPNYDSEGGTGAKEIGWLSNRRKEKIEAYVNNQLKSLVDNKLISKKPEVILYFDGAKTLTTPSGGWEDYKRWRKLTPEQQASDSKNKEYSALKKGYDTDQFTKIEFKIVPDLGENQCTFNVKIGVHYDNLSLGHKCNSARFQILANNVPLTTSDGTTCGTGLKYADMNNGGGSLDCKKSDIGGKRMNYFALNNAQLVNSIMAASADKKSIKITMKCTSTGFDDAAGRCHQDVPHITIHNTDGVKTVDTYPKANDAVLITIDKCGNLISGGGGTPTVSKDAGGKTTTVTTTVKQGARLNFAAVSGGTLNSEQTINNFINSGTLSKNTDGTYKVLKRFINGGLTYNVGDTIVKVLPKGSAITTATTTQTTIKKG